MVIVGSGKLRRTLDATHNTAKPGVSSKTWLKLLSELTDDELVKYGEIAKDQRNLEFERSRMQVIGGIVALVALVLGVREGIQNGMTGLTVICLVLAGIPGFWIFQKSRTRRFWSKHCDAVTQEQTRRSAAAGGKAD